MQIAETTPAPGANTLAPDFALAHLTPAAPPALAPAPAPAALPPNIFLTPAAPPGAAAEPAAPTPAPSAQAAPAPDKAATPTPPHAVARRDAPPPKKPRAIATAKHEAPKAPAIALHAPPRTPANVSGPFRVQFGAFANEENAQRVQWAIEATGLKVEVTHAPGSTKGEMLYYLRSPLYPDYAAALRAAQTVHDRVQNFVNAIPIDYAILGDRNGMQQASAR